MYPINVTLISPRVTKLAIKHENSIYQDYRYYHNCRGYCTTDIITTVEDIITTVEDTVLQISSQL